MMISTCLSTLFSYRLERPASKDWTLQLRKHFAHYNASYSLKHITNCFTVSIHCAKKLIRNDESKTHAAGYIFNPITAKKHFNRAFKEAIDLGGTSYMVTGDGGYGALLKSIAKVGLRPYSNIIINGKMKCFLGAKHSFNGIVLPSTDGAFNLFLFDAHGIIPDVWLDPAHFDNFYEIEDYIAYSYVDFRNNCQTYLSNVLGIDPERLDDYFTHHAPSKEVGLSIV